MNLQKNSGRKWPACKERTLGQPDVCVCVCVCERERERERQSERDREREYSGKEETEGLEGEFLLVL